MGKSTERRSQRRFLVVVASDGSRPAHDAVKAAVDFPWPPHAHATGVVARGGLHFESALSVALALDSVVRGIALQTERVLRRRWPDASVKVADASPIDAILQSARGAGAVVVGSRGHSTLQRWMLGSVSSAVVRHATVPVLVVKERPKAFQKLVIAYDGSTHANRAVAWVAALRVPRGGRATLLTLTDPISPPTLHLLPARTRAILGAEVKTLVAERAAKARHALERAARPLLRAGWRVRFDVRSGVAARDLVTMLRAIEADLLVIGAQGVSSWRRVLLGNVAQAAIDRAPVSVLVVR